MSKLLQSGLGLRIVDSALALRAVIFAGSRFKCPCCGWRLRVFTHGGFSLRSRPNGSCPRCNAKARHRRDWLYLEEQTDLFTRRMRLLHVSPRYALARRFARMADLDYIAVDLEKRPHVAIQADAAALPFEAASCDAIVCIHVLEHMSNDRGAMDEFFRVLKPGGWALVTTPIRLDQPTYEDPDIVDPAERARAFGEPSHVRYYGHDLIDRLHESGFDVTLDRGDELDPESCRRYGLLTDENVLLCRKPSRPSDGTTAR